MTVVADSSVAVKWFVPERDSRRALALLSGGHLIAPDFVVSQVQNVFWRKVSSGDMTMGRMLAATPAIPSCFVALTPTARLALRACEISLSLDIPVYGCFYIALAERERCIMVTADDMLYRKTRNTAYSATVRRLL
jgi:predicted nucleic acid-binding protein